LLVILQFGLMLWFAVLAAPYRLIRHPRYTSVLLAAAFVAVMDPLTAWQARSALALVLYAKSSLEERWLGEHHPQYKAYCMTCKGFVPWVF
jgi:protein-S-isoprenylcysteine O-methyltransferase Ste14